MLLAACPHRSRVALSPVLPGTALLPDCIFRPLPPTTPPLHPATPSATALLGQQSPPSVDCRLLHQPVPPRPPSATNAAPSSLGQSCLHASPPRVAVHQHPWAVETTHVQVGPCGNFFFNYHRFVTEISLTNFNHYGDYWLQFWHRNVSLNFDTKIFWWQFVTILTPN